ncbi:MAG: NUDIX hydrolase [Acetobacteraceae bacterium]|nr:NUDIX hydrolase [Acetobacteraceae bacterium]
MSESSVPPVRQDPVVPKPAASLLVLRAAKAPQVLMGMRGAAHKFMPNRLVFPGGRVDPEDLQAAPATPLPEHACALMAHAADAALIRAVGIAAARELEEETGLTLGLPPLLHGLDYLCRAITPDFSPVRFDARFLVVEAEHVGGTLAGSGELEDLRWYGVEEALGLDLAFPTRGVLEQLKLWMAMDAAARRARAHVATLRNRGWELE